ncbi:AraC family transcriptional regulator [Chitinophaga pendula]|uniref:helix-turn-helix domain-containing protein n=1 Tax=Chitinophaga TaxID=79328 RepID=UPI0012FE1CDE|nr:MULTISPECIES: AraC family transcriptional regulator [Chitinophaga]UCJ08568.1 AraC family transcriptional regulator [Chitinophaga pendula]
MQLTGSTMQQSALKIQDAMALYKTAPTEYVYEDTSSNEFLVADNSDSKRQGEPIRADHYGIILCLKGNCRKTVDHHTFDVAPQTIHLVAPRQLAAYDHGSTNLQLKMIFFKRSFLDSLKIPDALIDQLLHMPAEYPPIYKLEKADYTDILQLVQDIEKESKGQRQWNMQIVRLRMVELLFRMHRSCEDCAQGRVRSSNRSIQLVQDFRKMIDLHYRELKQVEDYARLLHVSAKHLSETIKQETGDTALTHIHQRILLEAQFLLNYSAFSIKEITDYLGYDSLSHFGRFFKQKKGLGPKEYRASGNI